MGSLQKNKKSTVVSSVPELDWVRETPKRYHSVQTGRAFCVVEKQADDVWDVRCVWRRSNRTWKLIELGKTNSLKNGKKIALGRITLLSNEGKL